ncbi:MAG: hypothetical protein ACKVS7_04560 [Gemmatimonadaceae bacterium]
MQRLIGRLVFAVLVLATFVGGIDAQESKKKRGDRNKLLQEEILEAGTAIVTARDAVRMLRPQWLNPPLGRMASSNAGGAGGGQQTVILYVDDTRQPDLEILTQVKAADIVEMRYLDQNRAVQYRGPGHEAGVIEIKTKRQP